MAIYGEIVNPSDPYTIEITDREAASAAVLALGRGKMAVQDTSGEEVLPLFLFADGDQIDAWWRQTYGHALFASNALADDAFRARMADALDSVAIGDAGDRELYDEMLAGLPDENREEFRRRRHDRRLTSASNIGAAAWELAAQLRIPLRK